MIPTAQEFNALKARVKKLEERAVVIPPPTETPKESTVLFNGSKVADFPENLCKPGRAKMVPDPADPTREVISLTCNDEDVGVTENPRAQLGTGYVLAPETPFTLHTRLWFGTGFPASINSWMTLLSMWGPPTGGVGAPAHFQTWDAKTLEFSRSTYNDSPWKGPLPRSRWVDVLWEGFLSEDPRRGFAAIKVDGVQVLKKLGMKTIDATCNQGNQNARLYVYYERGCVPGLQPVTVLFDGLKLTKETA